jgi:hypothetical protein
MRHTAIRRCHGDRSVFSLVKQYSCRFANMVILILLLFQTPGSIIRVKMAVVVRCMRLGITHFAFPHLADVYV